MTFKAGQVTNKVGRPKGSGRKIINAVAMMEDRNFNPIEKLMSLYEESSDEKIKFGCLKELRACYAPSLKAIEHSGEIGGTYTLNVAFGE